VLDEAIAVCRRAGFDDVLLRGDTDFTMSRHLDRWDDDGIRFVLGYDANPTFVDRAENVHPNDYEELVREAARVFSSTRAKKPRIKEEIVKERGYLNKRLVSEDTAEFDHMPSKAKKPYRIVVLRKYIVEERGQLTLSEDFRYFFYVTNDRTLTQADVIAESNARCNQENLIEQLKNGVRALHAPANTLNANWAYMVIASLAWTLKAWTGLLLPVSPRRHEAHDAQRKAIVRMDFRSFVQRFIMIPAQIIRSGRRTIYRLLAWRPDLPIFFRLLDAF
jgi:hypothetical protein